MEMQSEPRELVCVEDESENAVVVTDAAALPTTFGFVLNLDALVDVVRRFGIAIAPGQTVRAEVVAAPTPGAVDAMRAWYGANTAPTTLSVRSVCANGIVLAEIDLPPTHPAPSRTHVVVWNPLGFSRERAVAEMDSRDPRRRYTRYHCKKPLVVAATPFQQ